MSDLKGAETDSEPRSVPETAGARRVRFGTRTAALLCAVTASCAFIALIGARTSLRADVTATREHHLSERTRAVLDSLDGRHEIVVVANLQSVDDVSRRRTLDVLSLFDRASDRLTVTAIDVASTRGIGEVDALLERLAQRSGAELERQQRLLADGESRVRELAARLVAVSVGLGRVRDAVGETERNAEVLKRGFDDYSIRGRAAAEELARGADEAAEKLAERLGGTSVVPVDEAAGLLRRRLGNVAPLLVKVADDLAAVLEASADLVSLEVKDAARPLAPEATSIRDAAQRMIGELDSLRPPPVLTAARVLERSSAALVIGPDEGDGTSAAGTRRPLVAVDIESLLAPQVTGIQGDLSLKPIDMRFRTEELLAGGLASLDARRAPIVVIVHGASERERLSPNFAPLGTLVGRLRTRGMDVVEWAAAVDPEPPSLRPLDPGGTRPAVYVTIATNAMSAEGSLRMNRLAQNIEKLIADGRRVLLSCAPSQLPTQGAPDPMVAFLTPLGVRIATGLPILRQVSTPRGQLVETDLLLVEPGLPEGAPAHPITVATNGLLTKLSWVVGIHPAAPSVGAAAFSSLTPLLRVRSEPGVWAESEWVGFWQTPVEQRGLVVDPPSRNSPLDESGAPDGWTIAATIERTLPGERAPQRVVVVGANGWFLDVVTQQGQVIDGRRVESNPGNLEFFEACVYWLADRDEMITRSATAQAAPLIPVLHESTRAALSWFLILGMPGLVLLTGAVTRLARG